MKFYIIYKCGNHNISDLCVNCGPDASILVPRIGETFCDIDDIEYEVIDIVRVLESPKEYGIQVMLKERTERKYKNKRRTKT